MINLHGFQYLRRSRQPTQAIVTQYIGSTLTLQPTILDLHAYCDYTQPSIILTGSPASLDGGYWYPTNSCYLYIYYREERVLIATRETEVAFELSDPGSLTAIGGHLAQWVRHFTAQRGRTYMIRTKGFGAGLRRHTDIPVHAALAHHIGVQLRTESTKHLLDATVERNGLGTLMVHVDYHHIPRQDQHHRLPQLMSFRAVTILIYDDIVEFSGRTICRLLERLGSTDRGDWSVVLSQPDSLERLDLMLRALIGMSEAQIEIWKWETWRHKE